MKFMHSFKMIAHPKVTSCVLKGNPFYEATVQAAHLAGADFVLNALINKKKEPVGFVARRADRRSSCRLPKVEETSVIRLNKPADLVITQAEERPWMPPIISRERHPGGQGHLQTGRNGGPGVRLCTGNRK